MGSLESVPATFQLTIVDGRAVLSFRRPLRAPSDGAAAAVAARASGDAHDASGVRREPLSFVGVNALDLGDAGPPPGPAMGTADGTAAATTASIGRLQNRRLAILRATLDADVARLSAALAACPLADLGITEARLWMDPVGLRLGGRATIGNRTAPFTIRVAFDPRADGRRRLRIVLADVRLFGHLPLPAPLLGAAIAGGVAAAAATVGSAVRARGPMLDVDPLELALIPRLVGEGWRLPDLRRGWLELVETTGDGLRLEFASEGHPTQRLASLDYFSGTPMLSFLEGERLPDRLAEAEGLLFEGDLVGAEAAYRRALADAPADRAVQTRLLMLAAATGAADAGARAASMMATWPELLPAVLVAASIAREVGDGEGAAALFDRAARIAAARGEDEDARLAIEAAEAARATHVYEDTPSSIAELDAVHYGAGAAPADSGPIVDSGASHATDGWGVVAEDASPSASDQIFAAVADDDDGAVPDGGIEGDAGPVTARTQAVYARHDDDGDDRATALRALFDELENLDRDSRHAAYASVGRVAEASGDLEHAEEAYWRAMSISGASARDGDGDRDGVTAARHRANDLVAHARTLAARGNPTGAAAELDEALSLSPGHAGALGALAGAAFAAGDVRRARDLYTALAAAPGAADVIPRDTLMFRRAALARSDGDVEEAEMRLRELVEASPAHVDGHRALAELAREHGDPATAVSHFEQVLRLLPPHAVDDILRVRRGLGETYVELEDWGSARHYIELVLAHDPMCVPVLEQLVNVADRLHLAGVGADACARLARLYVEPARRAEALYREGEIRRHARDAHRGGDADGGSGGDDAAFDAYLRSSDLDPTFAPTALRLVEEFWRRGQLSEAIEVADELRRVGPLPAMSRELRVRLALALALVRGDAAEAHRAAALAGVPYDATAGAVALGEAAERLSAAADPSAALEPAVALLALWEGRP